MIYNVKTASADYPVCFEQSFSELSGILRQLNLVGRKIFVITDSNVKEIYASQVIEALREITEEIFCYSFQAGESQKNLATTEAIYDYLISNRADRKTVIVALGGGVTGDLAGFAAATFMRGVPFVQIPTTLLSQVDSSIGGKVGVDRLEQKNIVGAFYQPKAVYINVETLSTLPEEQFSSGMGEVVKHGLALDAGYYEYLSLNREKIKARDTDTLTEMIKGSCRLKAGVVSKDEKESGLREILNFGHTAGHAVESLKGFTIPHGHCVGIGMAAALFLAGKRGLIKPESTLEAEELLKYFGIPVRVQGLTSQEIYGAMLRDKKNKNGIINMVLLEGLGNAFTDDTVTKAEILPALDYILTGKA